MGTGAKPRLLHHAEKKVPQSSAHECYIIHRKWKGGGGGGGVTDADSYQKGWDEDCEVPVDEGAVGVIGGGGDHAIKAAGHRTRGYNGVAEGCGWGQVKTQHDLEQKKQSVNLVDRGDVLCAWTM